MALHDIESGTTGQTKVRKALDGRGATFVLLLSENGSMSTTTVRIDDELKERIGAAAERAGQTPHAFIVEAVAARVAEDEEAAELEHLAEVREVCQTVNSGGWRRILAQMEAFVQEAQEDMIGAVYASDSIKAALQMRWQQRVAMLRGVEKYVSACENERTALLSEVTQQRSVPTEIYAEQD